jgi:hypothetical protein
MFRRSLWVALIAISLGGCASEPLPPLEADHPASPDAEEVPLPPASTTLSVSDSDPVKPVIAQPSAVHDGHAGHGAPDHKPNAEPRHREKHEHGATHEHGTSATKPAAPSVYACPMHPEVISDKPDKCPKCGMRLIQQKRAGTEHGDHP